MGLVENVIPAKARIQNVLKSLDSRRSLPSTWSGAGMTKTAFSTTSFI